MAHDGADEQALMVTLLLKKVVSWGAGDTSHAVPETGSLRQEDPEKSYRPA